MGYKSVMILVFSPMCMCIQMYINMCVYMYACISNILLHI